MYILQTTMQTWQYHVFISQFVFFFFQLPKLTFLISNWWGLKDLQVGVQSHGYSLLNNYFKLLPRDYYIITMTTHTVTIQFKKTIFNYLYLYASVSLVICVDCHRSSTQGSAHDISNIHCEKNRSDRDQPIKLCTHFNFGLSHCARKSSGL